MNVKSIYGHENQFLNNKFMDNTIKFVHKTWGGVWVVIAISSYICKLVNFTVCAICCTLDSQITPSTEDLQASTN